MAAERKKNDVEWKCINTIRCFCADMVQKANSGHPGMPMGMAPVAHVLWTRIMRFNPSNPLWMGRDRFVLSNGHGCALLYFMLHLTGYNMPMEELLRFRQLNSITPGHPERSVEHGIEVTTGPLGQGISNAVGMALAGEHLAARYRREGVFNPFDGYVYCFCGDGCLMEGISSEAASLAGHLGLSRLILIYDNNHVSIDGDTALAFSTEDVPKRFEAYGFSVQIVKDGDNDLDGIERALNEARKADRPSLIVLNTTIGFASSKQGTGEVHGSPLGDEDVANVKKKLGMDPTKFFHIPDEVKTLYGRFKEEGKRLEARWQEQFRAYSERYPEDGAEITRRTTGKLPDGWEQKLPRFSVKDAVDATRGHSGKVLNALAQVLPELIGGSADLTPSNKTALKGEDGFSRTNRKSRYIHFGVREHAMFGIGNGIDAYGGCVPFTATFFNFLEYGFPSARLAALSHHRQIMVLTHESIGLGEDGPTHQPVEVMALVRATPNMLDLRPADGNEVTASYIAAVRHRGPSAIALTRQNVPNLEKSSVELGLRGAYAVFETEDFKAQKPDVILVGTGSEVGTCVGVAKRLKRKVRVVSMPSWYLFRKQPRAYRTELLVPGVPVVTVEALATTGWERYGHFNVGLNTFGASAPAKDLFKHFRLDEQGVFERVTSYLDSAAATARAMGFPSLAGPLPTHFAEEGEA